jgi:hypothetical protein
LILDEPLHIAHTLARIQTLKEHELPQSDFPDFDSEDVGEVGLTALILVLFLNADLSVIVILARK